MGVLGNIWVKLGLKSDDFRRGMDQSEQKVSRFSQTTKKMSMMAKAAWLAVGAAVIKFGKESVKAYNEQMAANAKLQNAIKNTNGALGLSYRELEKYASQIQSSFNVADDAAMNAMATMTTFGSVTGKMFKDAMQAAVDMAAFMGSDLTAEVKRLGLALEVPEIGVTQLRRAGIAFTNEQIAGIKKLLVEGKKYEAQMIILEGVQKKFGGAAKAAAETAQGAWKGAKMAVGDFMETVGRGIEGTKGVAVVIKDLFAGWSEARSAGGRKLFNATQEIDEYKRYIDATVGSGEFERRAARVLDYYKKSLAEGTKIIDLNGKVIKEKYAKVYFAALEKYLKDLTDTGEGAAGVMIGAAEEMIEVNTATEESYNGLIGKIDETISALEEKKKAATSISEIAAINDEIAALSKLKESYEALSAVMLEMGRIPLPKVDGSGKVTTPVTTTVPMNGIDIDALTKKYGKQKEEVQEIEKSFMRITDAVYRITYSGLELAEMFGLDPEIARTLNEMVGSVLDIVDAMDAVTKATNTAAEAVGDVGSSMGQTGSAVLAVFGAVLSINSAIIKIDMALKQAKMDERVARINDELERVKRLVDDIGASMGEGWFVTDNFEKVKDLNAELTTLASHAAVAMKQWVNSFADTLTSSEDMRESVKATFADVTALANQLNSEAFDSAFSGQMLGNIDLLNDALGQMETLANTGTDAEKAMAEAAIELLEQAIGTYDELRSTISSMVGDISGTLYNTVTVEWKKIWQENKEAGADSFAGIAEAAKKNIAEIMENLVTQQIWASVMAPVFDSLGTNLTNAIAGGGDITSVFDDFFAGFDANLQGYYGALDKFYTDAESRGWSFGEQDTKLPEDSIKAMREELVKLQEQWESLSALDREGDIGQKLLGDIADLEDKIAATEKIEESAEAAKDSIQGMNEELARLREQYYNLSKEDREGDIGANLFGDITDLEERIRLAEEYYKAIETGQKDAEGSINALNAKLSELNAQWDALSPEERGGDIGKNIADQIALYKQLLEYATLGYEQQKAIEAANEASQAWKDALEGVLDVAEKQYDKMMVLQEEYKKALTNYIGLDAGPMKDAAKEYLDYLEGLLKDQEELLALELENLNRKYETEYEKHLSNLAEFDSDYNDAKLLGDQELMAKILAQREEYNDKYIQQQKDTASAEAQALLEGSEEYKALTGDLAKSGVEEARKALDAYRKMVEGSEDLSEEAKAEILTGLDDIQEKIDDIELDNLQQQFDDIQSVISSISSILGSFGASSELTEGLSGLSTVIGGLFSVISGGSWVDKFAGIASMIGGIVTVAKSLKGLFTTGNEDLTGGVDALSAAYQKLVGIMGKAFGDNKASLQQQAIENIKAQIAEYQRLIKEEESKTGFWDWLKGDLKDDSLILQYKQAIENLYKELGRYDEETKNDWLQTDTNSFVNSLRDIWAQSYDSAEDYYNALKKLNQQTVDDIIARWIEKKLVEDQVNSALGRLYESGMTDPAFDLFGQEIQAISDNAKREYEKWQDAGYFQDEEGGSSMDGSIARTATEAQFNQYLGYVQNLNITAHDILNALSDQPALIDFSALAQISRGIANDVERIKDNTEYCRMLESMKNDLAAIRRGSSVAYN